MFDFQLVSFSICPYAQRVQFAMEELKLPYSIKYIDPYQSKPEWFKKISPRGKVPILVADSSSLFESKLILDYLNDISDNGLHDTGAMERSKHRMLIMQAEYCHEIIGNIFSAKSEQDFKAAIESVVAKLTELDQGLEDTLLNTAKPSMLNCVLAPLLYLIQLLENMTDHAFLSGLARLSEWRSGLLDKPTFKKCISDQYLNDVIRFFKTKNSILSKYASLYQV